MGSTTTDLVEMVIKIAERFSIERKDLPSVCLKLTVLSLKYVNRRAMWEQLFGDDYVDWPLVEQQTQHNIVGGCSEWLLLMQNMTWTRLAEQETAIRVTQPPLAQLRANVRACGLDTGDAGLWTLVCKIMILLMVQSLKTSYCLEMLTCQLFKEATAVKCRDLMAKQAEVLFTPDEYYSAFVFLFQNVTVDRAALESSLAAAKSRVDGQRRALTQSRMLVLQGRPSLRDRVRSLYQSEDRTLQVDAMLQTWDSFAGFCFKHQFPTTLSEKVKIQLYFMACQTRWGWEAHLHKIVNLSDDMLRRITQHRVAIPDPAVIQRVVQALAMEGSAPFPEMTDFRRACFGSFPVSHTQRMPLSIILQLYVCAYQPESIWRECWRSTIGVISNQIILDVEAFVKGHPFAAAPVVKLLVGG